MKCIIMAGGYAKRLWPLTKEIAKPLLPVAGKPIISYILDKLEQVSPIDIIYISTNRLFAKQFEEWKASVQTSKKIEIVVEETLSEEEKLGAIGALRFLIREKKIDDDLLVVAGDNLLGFEMADFANAFGDKPLVALSDIGDKSKASSYGVAALEGKRITSFVEKPDEPQSSLVSTACYLYPKHVLQLFDAYFEQGQPKDAPGHFLTWLHKLIEVEAFVFKGTWFDIGSREAYIRANLEHFDGSMLGSEPDASEVERSYVGKGCTITNSRIRNCVILDNCTIEGCTLSDCVVSNGTELKKEEKEAEIL